MSTALGIQQARIMLHIVACQLCNVLHALSLKYQVFEKKNFNEHKI